MEDYQTKNFLYLTRLEFRISQRSFFSSMRQELRQLNHRDLISSQLETKLNVFLMTLSTKVRKFNFEHRQQSWAIESLFNFLMAAQQDTSKLYNSINSSPVCQFIINRIGIDSFKGLNTKKFADLKWLVLQFYRVMYPTQLKQMQAYLDMAVRFHKPFYPLGFSTFWKEVYRSVQKEKFSEEIETFIKTVQVDSELLYFHQQKRSRYMAQLYILYIEYSFKAVIDNTT